MKKIVYVLLSAVLLAAYSNVQAQKSRWSIGTELGLNVGSVRAYNASVDESISIGFGVSGRWEKPLGKVAALMITPGFQVFSGTSTQSDPFGNTYKSSSTRLLLPLMFGAKFYFMGQQNGFYASVETGFVSYATTYNYTSSSSYADPTTAVNFALATGVGYHIAHFDFGMRYQSILGTAPTASNQTSLDTFNHLGFRIAYVFGKKE